ncbi:MAG TPA: cyclopropane-fatty-acyl-phospholipid synthase family protein [Nevskiaceae bacterium]|nr:cyclopropane-fatty-acyl-phospholipid synthase family protein [Nevskiaceae bacterium]
MDITQFLLDRISRRFGPGSLEIEAPGGRRWQLGRGEPHARMVLHRAPALARMLLDPELAFGESYVDGDWDAPDGLLPVLHAALSMTQPLREGPGSRRWRRLRSLGGEFNSRARSRRNVEHHYDLDFDLYRRFLDADLHYSCAYFREPGMSLEAAQQAKCAHIAAKLDLAPGAQVLDIGCGWGSLALYLAEHFDVRVTGITLSREQLDVARRRALQRGLAGRVDFRLQDYRETAGAYDAIVSVGMFEHVGRPYYDAFFRQLPQLARPDTVMLLHTIGRSSPPGSTNPWVRKYIFPGGYTPAASEVLAAAEKSGLVATDLEVWRLHYASTLREWHVRFQQARADIRERMGERFCRMWEFYLQACEASFRWDDLRVFHLQLSARQDRLPLTRDYLYRAADVESREPARARLRSVR